MENSKLAFDKMEKELLPVFKDAVQLCKTISGNPDYFSDYKAARRLYAMAITSKVIKSVNKDISSNEHKKKNIDRIDLYCKETYFYQPDGSKKKENIFQRPEILEFQKEMKDLGASYYDDAIMHECLGSFAYDAAIGIYEGDTALISPDGNVLDWKNAKNLGIFEFASAGIKNEMFIDNMNSLSKQNNWNKKEWNKNYPVIHRECEEKMKEKFASFCTRKQQDIVLKNINKKAR